MDPIDETRTAARSSLAAGLTALGFQEVSRQHGRGTWIAAVNTYLQFQLQEEGERVVVTWRVDLGEFMLARGWQIGGAETSFQELYPQRDVAVPADTASVEAEIRRTLGLLRIDLGDPDL